MEASPLDVALKPMDNFDMTQLSHTHADGTGHVNVILVTSSTVNGAVMECATGCNHIKIVMSLAIAPISITPQPIILSP